MANENNILRIDNGIFEKKETIIDNFLFKFILKVSLDSSINEEVVSVCARNILNNELIVYEKILNCKDFKASGNLFQSFEIIKDIYEFLSILIENNKIEIKEIVHDNFIDISLKSTSKDLIKIKLLKRDCNNEEIIEILDYCKKNINELKEENNRKEEQLKEKNEKQLKKGDRKINEENNKNKIPFVKISFLK
eukprot:jgi/Orpsp1_1/1184116/evm.model.c7180000088083.1